MPERETALRTPLESSNPGMAEIWSAARDPARRRQCGWSIHAPDRDLVGQVLTDLEEHARADGGLVIRGAWRPGLERPLGGLLAAADQLTGWAMAHDSQILRRYGRTLVTLLPARRGLPPLRQRSAHRAGAAAFLLRGDLFGLADFYQRRNIAMGTMSDVVHFVLDCAEAHHRATGAPTLLCLDDFDRADSLTRRALRRLVRYARRVPIVVCAGSRKPLAEGAADATDVTWRSVRLEAAGGSTVADEIEALTAEEFELLAAAVTPALPFTREEWLALAAPLEVDPTATVERFVARGWVRDLGGDRWTVPRAPVVNAVERRLSEDRRRELHRRALEITKDPFAAAFHAGRGSDVAEVHRQSLLAMERAWGASAYDCALHHAEQAAETLPEDSSLDRRLMLGLLTYEAEDYQSADRHLSAAFASGDGDDLERVRIRRLQGYNAIFGLGEFDRGREILQEVLVRYEAEGMKRESAYLRNSIAFALFRSRNADDALDLEELTFDTARKDDAGAFLLSLLQLNIGRLYRFFGRTEEALASFQKGVNAQNARLNPYLLCLYQASIGHLYSKHENHGKALTSLHHVHEVLRGLTLDTSHDRVLHALSSVARNLPSDGALRGDETLFCLHANLAIASRSAGLDDRAAAYLEGVRRQRDLLGEAVDTVEKLIAAAPTAPADNSDEIRDFELRVSSVTAASEAVVAPASDGEDLAEEVAGALADGEVVAVVRPRSVGSGYSLIDSLILYDPGRSDLAQRMGTEVVGSHFADLPGAQAALALPAALDLFPGAADLPLVLQETTVEPHQRSRLAALFPVRTRVQILDPALDGLLYRIVEAFGRRTELPVLAAGPFHLQGRADLVVDPEQALYSFLISSIDRLVLGETLLHKSHGATARENLLEFRPKWARRSALVRGRSDNGAEERILLKARSPNSPNRFLELHPKTRPILELCDGRLSVAEIVERLRDDYPVNGGGGLAREIGPFLRSLWHRGGIVFDDPASTTSAV